MAEEGQKADVSVLTPSKELLGLIPGTQLLKHLSLPSPLCTRSIAIQSLVPSSDGEFLWACCNDGTIIMWDVKTGEVVGSRQAHKATIFELICVSNASNPFARAGWTIWAACMDSTVTLYNPSLCMVKKLSLGASSATSLVQVGRFVYVADAKQIFVFHSQSYELMAMIDLPRLEHLKGGLEDEDLCPSVEGEGGKTENNFSKVSAAHTIVARRTLAGVGSSDGSFSGYFVRCMAVVGKYVWICTDGFVCFVNAETHSIVPSVYIPIAKVNSIAWVPSLQQVWGGCSDSRIYIWDESLPEVHRGAASPSYTLDGFTSDRISRLMNLNDQFIFCGAWDKFIRVWDPKTRAMLWQSSQPHECPIMAIIPLQYPWLKLIPTAQEAKEDVSPSSTISSAPYASPASSIQSAQSSNASHTPTPTILQRRDTQTVGLAPSHSEHSSAHSLSQSTSTAIPRSQSQESVTSNLDNRFGGNSLSGSSGPSTDTATIWTVFTADWSSVSLWV